MGHQYAATMFSPAAKALQELHHSRAQYERLAALGPSHDALGEDEAGFIAARDSFYLGSVNEEGWPYIQHRGGPAGFLHVLDGKTLAFADFAGNKQYITAGNLVTNDRVSLFLMDYPHQARLKIIGHARIVELGVDGALEARLREPGYPAKVERMMVIAVVAFDWNCSQHITPRFTEEEMAGGGGCTDSWKSVGCCLLLYLDVSLRAICVSRIVGCFLKNIVTEMPY